MEIDYRKYGGEAGIRTLGGELPPQPLSRRLPSAGSATSPEQNIVPVQSVFVKKRLTGFAKSPVGNLRKRQPGFVGISPSKKNRNTSTSTSAVMSI
jgi:hypothetical protein